MCRMAEKMTSQLWLTLTLLQAGHISLANAQHSLIQKGQISVSDSSRLKVSLLCEPSSMKIQLVFLNASRFTDWIVVGPGQNEKCRLRGNGDTGYTIQLPLMSDLCGTKMILSGTFENTLSIRSNPLLVLQGDEIVNIRCVYGPPEIATPAIPVLPTSPLSAFIPRTSSETPIELVPQIVEEAGLPISYVYLIVFMILFAAVLFLLCGCLYFFIKRRRIRVERRKRALSANVPRGVDLNGKMDLLHTSGLWWPGKLRLSRDTLLNHDYMLSANNSGREQISATPSGSEYAGETASSDSSGSPAHSRQLGAQHNDIRNRPRDGFFNQVFVHDYQHVCIPRVSHQMADPDRLLFSAINSLQSIPEENLQNGSKSNSVLSAEGPIRVGTNKKVAAVYACVDVTKKHDPAAYSQSTETFHTLEHNKEGSEIVENVPTARTPALSMHSLGSVRGYRFDQLLSTPGNSWNLPHSRKSEDAHVLPDDRDDDSSNESSVTLDGRPCRTAESSSTNSPTTVLASLTKHQRQKAALSDRSAVVMATSAQVHQLSAETLDELIPPNRPLPAPPANDPVEPPLTRRILSQEKDDSASDLTPFLKAVEENRGFGPRKLLENDIRRWKTMVANDNDVRTILRSAKSKEDLEELCCLPKYANSFTQQRWTLIVQSLAHVVFTRKLANIIDGQAAQMCGQPSKVRQVHEF